MQQRFPQKWQSEHDYPLVKQPTTFIQKTFYQYLGPATLCLIGLLCFQTVHAAACNPSLQSCGSTSTPTPGRGTSTGGGQTCTPSPGGSTCGGSGVASQGNSSGTDQGAGNPINIINGNKYQREADMPALPGVLGLEVVRHYNSQYSLPNVPSGILGRGWKLSYETALYNTAVGLQIVQADGTRLIFQKSATDRTRCTSPDPAHGVVTILDTPQGKEYIWRWPGNGKDAGRALWFNTEGKLVQIAAPTGEAVNLLYAPGGRLLQVRDPQSRVLNLTYLDTKTAQANKAGAQKFRGVQSIDSPVGRFTYHYGNPLPEGSAKAPTLTVANLTQVSLPTWHDPSQRSTHAFSNIGPSRSSIARIYHYEDPKFPTLLTGISVQGSGSDGVSMHQRISTYGYDSWGKAVLSQKAEGIEKVSLDTSTPKQTILTNSLGQTTTYQHADIAGQWRLLASRGAGCAQCGPANMRYGYDSLGRLTEQTTLNAQGQAVYTLRTTLDVQGRPQKLERITYVGTGTGKDIGRPGPAKWQVRYEYPSDHAREPSLVAWPSVQSGKEHQIKTQYNAVGQPTEVSETGYEPVEGKPLERTTRYRYETISLRSVLVAIDGPLPNGPHNSAQDSDITQLVWDKGANFVIAVTQPGGRTHSVSHERGTGLLSEVKNANGFDTQFVYDTQTRLITTRSNGPGWPQPRTQSYRYDALGYATEMGTGEDSDTVKTFKAQARQGFDAAGRLLWHADALGMLIHNRYDSESHLTQTGRYTNAVAQETRFANDAPKQPVKLTQPVQHFADDFGRLVLSLSADHGRSRRSYDQADRLISMSDAMGHVAVYQYTLRGRIASQKVTHAQTGKIQTTQWRYNPQGQLLEISHSTQTERYEYDARGLQTARIVTLKTGQDQTASEHTAITRYSHDDQGQLATSTLPDGTQLQYLRNGQGQVVQVTRNPIRTPWLRWLGHEQTIVKDLARDLVGLKRYTSGNGIQAQYQRSPQGVLARIVYQQHTTTGAPPSQPGALGLPADPLALLEHRYLWDIRGKLLYTQSAVPAATSTVANTDASKVTQTVVRRSSYAYDQQARLVATSTGLVAEPGHQNNNRYAYDGAGRRVLSQQDFSDPNELKAGTQAHAYQAGSHRLMSTDTSYSDNGQPLRMAGRQFEWDALGRLSRVTASGDNAATSTDYTYDHRGLRTAKHVGTRGGTGGQHTTYYVYDAQRQPLAELNAHGRITRQYFYLADLPLALIDSPEGQALSTADESLLEQTLTAMQDVGTAVQSWFNAEAGMGQLVWLHTNHLGAPEAATNAQGQLVWQARYEAFGAAHVNEGQTTQAQQGASQNAQPFGLNLRLPGQYFDVETGLHYNRQRYYDPQAGQYLTPDPLGNPDGPNPYAYVRYNPLGNVDPDGLVLFAFDGTNSSNPPAEHSTYSNVYKFYLAYDVSDVNSGNGDKAWYMNGVGRDDNDSQIETNLTDALDGNTGHARVQYMLGQLDSYINHLTFSKDTMVNIDMVGFSRGAAEARDFSNRVAQQLLDKTWGAKTACVQMRYLGLWDTVAQFGPNGADNGSWQLVVPPEVKNVYQAVAMNENRYLFPGEAVGRGVQRGFVGAHADIGGGYGTGDLSDVALNWMVEQAKASGVAMRKWGDNGTEKEWGIVTNPVVHGKGVDLLNSDFCLRANNERWADNCTLRKDSNPGGLTTQQIADLKLITYDDTLGKDADGSTPIDGTVNMEAYVKWLKKNYQLTIITAP